MSDYVRVPNMEEAFKNRYNRDVEVYLWRQGSDKYSVKIIGGGREYILTETLERGSPVHTIVEYDNISHQYPLYVFAEIDVADKMGAN